jgi:hypothetical protein
MRTLATTDMTADHSLLLSTSGRTGFTSREGLMLMSECSSARSAVMHFAAIWPICLAAAALIVAEEPLSRSWRRRSSLGMEGGVRWAKAKEAGAAGGITLSSYGSMGAAVECGGDCTSVP